MFYLGLSLGAILGIIMTLVFVVVVLSFVACEKIQKDILKKKDDKNIF